MKNNNFKKDKTSHFFLRSICSEKKLTSILLYLNNISISGFQNRIFYPKHFSYNRLNMYKYVAYSVFEVFMKWDT